MIEATNGDDGLKMLVVTGNIVAVRRSSHPDGGALIDTVGQRTYWVRETLAQVAERIQNYEHSQR